MLGMSDIDMSYRYWGIAYSNMLNIYIHLSKEMNSESYKQTMGMSGEDTKVVNPLAVRCVKCGKLIQSGDLCEQCKENKVLNAKLQIMEGANADLQEDMKKLKEKLNKIADAYTELLVKVQ